MKARVAENKKEFLKENIFFILTIIILFIGCFARLIYIDIYPVGLNQDEASSAYEAWSIMNYGLGRNNESYPVHFIAWGSGQNYDLDLPKTKYIWYNIMGDNESGNMEAIDLFNELLLSKTVKEVAELLNLHVGTVRRWQTLNSVPNNYYNDLNSLLDYKYENKDEYRDKDQFYTTKETAIYCYNKTLEVLKKLSIDASEYVFIEPSAGCCNFYRLLPRDRRIGVDIEPKGRLKGELIQSDYLRYFPEEKGKYIVIGNPPFGLRGNLALRFMNHSYEFADVVAFILPPLFNSTGKGVPMTRVKGYKLAYTENLQRKAFEYPDGSLVDVATIFQVWTKVNIDKIEEKEIKTCDSYAKVYSLSDGGKPSNTRNKKMLNACDVYLPSTCFKGMKAYDNFEALPNRRGYGVVFKKDKEKLKDIFFNEIDWEKVAFQSTNGALNLRTDLIMKEITDRGYYDE